MCQIVASQSCQQQSSSHISLASMPSPDNLADLSSNCSIVTPGHRIQLMSHVVRADCANVTQCLALKFKYESGFHQATCAWGVKDSFGSMCHTIKGVYDKQSLYSVR